LFGEGGNDLLTGGRDNDALDGGLGRNDLSGEEGDDCFFLGGVENERASGGEGDDIIFAIDGNGDDIFCGAGDDAVQADVEDRVAASCENVLEPSSSLRAGGATPEPEVTINGAPEEFGS
jgi:Ca2+-binding RTX toxin-like protein